MSNCFVASTKGFDEFFPKNLSVIDENRLYPIVNNPLDVQKTDTQSGRVTITYNDNPKAKTVEVRGSWDEWHNGTPLQKSEQGAFKATLDIPTGTYVYKFIIDGNWGVDHTKPIIHEGGSENNLVKVSDQINKHSNMWAVRNELNKIHKKIATKYPEFYLDEIVLIHLL